MKAILGQTRAELHNWLTGIDQPGYRTDQILQWLYRHDVCHFQDMKNLPARLIEALAEEYVIRAGKVLDLKTNPDRTCKVLLGWPDGASTETVMMYAGRRRSVCVSTQVGCPVGCVFCASGRLGLERSLSAGEMVEQVLWARSQLGTSERISNVVVMGMGEPFANYEETLRAVRIINAQWGLAIGARHITISTIGLPEQIRRLAEEPLQVTLAISLHAPDDKLRGSLIPWARRISLADIFQAVDYYYRKTHREVTLEYILLAGVNCLPCHADKLSRLARKSRCNVNLIRYNPVPGSGFLVPGPEVVQAFMERLQAGGVNCTLRRSLGADIDAACGQLRQRRIAGSEPE